MKTARKLAFALVAFATLAGCNAVLGVEAGELAPDSAAGDDGGDAASLEAGDDAADSTLVDSTVTDGDSNSDDSSVDVVTAADSADSADTTIVDSGPVVCVFDDPTKTFDHCVFAP